MSVTCSPAETSPRLPWLSQTSSTRVSFTSLSSPSKPDSPVSPVVIQLLPCHPVSTCRTVSVSVSSSEPLTPRMTLGWLRMPQGVSRERSMAWSCNNSRPNLYGDWTYCEPLLFLTLRQYSIPVSPSGPTHTSGTGNISPHQNPFKKTWNLNIYTICHFLFLIRSVLYDIIQCVHIG